MARILIPTDFSDNSMHAAEYAVRLFGKTGNHYVLLHVFMDPATDPQMSGLLTNELMKASEEGLRMFTDRFVRSTEVDGADQQLRYGTLAPVVRGMVAEERIDAVVMGKRGHTGSLFFGSNTIDVIKHGHASVLVVPENAPHKDLEHILLADDHDELFPTDLSLLRSIALAKKADVLVAHMEMEPDEGDDHWSNGLYELALKDVPHTFISTHGRDVVDGLEHLARRRRMDMIAVLHRHLGLLEGLFHQSAAKQLASETDLPLLVLQHGGQ
ncbi:MAG: universal stress protein [Flavobacteriales bacterium]|nr:universal stress protein [Flavobacteriales bacterium]